MFRVIGVIAVVGTVGLGVAYYQGYVSLDGSAEVTDKGSEVYNQGLDEFQNLTQKGLDALRHKKSK